MACLENIEGLLEDLDATDIFLSQEAQARLVVLGVAVVEHLISVLQTGSVRQRANAALVLGTIGNTRAIDPLYALSTDPSLTVRVNCASALGLIDDPRVVSSLIDWLEREEKAVVQSMIVKSLADKQDKRSTIPLIGALKRVESPSVRYIIIRALGNLGDPVAIESILPFVDDEDYHVKHDAKLALEKLGYCVR